MLRLGSATTPRRRHRSSVQHGKTDIGTSLRAQQGFIVVSTAHRRDRTHMASAASFPEDGESWPRGRWVIAWQPNPVSVFAISFRTMAPGGLQDQSGILTVRQSSSTQHSKERKNSDRLAPASPTHRATRTRTI